MTSTAIPIEIDHPLLRRDPNLAEQRRRAALLLSLALPHPVDVSQLGPENDDASWNDLLATALEWRAELESFDDVTCEDSPGLLHFSRPYGWHCLTNFSAEPMPLPEGIIVISSSPITEGDLPPATTVWLLRWVE